MSFNYEYTREKIEGMWDINNPLRVDGEGNQIRLSSEVQAAIPAMPFKMNCEGALALFSFETELSAGEKSTLDTTVQNHKDNT